MPYLFNGHNRGMGELKRTVIWVDLLFGHHEELHAGAELLDGSDGRAKLVQNMEV